MHSAITGAAATSSTVGTARSTRRRLPLRRALVASAVLASMFSAVGSANAASGVTIHNQYTGSVLDARGQGTGNWTEIWSYWANDQDNQKWTFHEVSTGVYNIQGLQSGRCIDIAHSDYAGPGYNLVLWDCNGNASQKWIAHPLASGGYQLQSSLNPAWCMATDAINNNVKINWCDSGSGSQTYTWS
ncbi:RICIN domain-containing protein [Streptantibioticus rubrisoli]|uniref:RICIN domain-containing protein n=1 Tax=Streptantibioticus rubrisoli TaxID=1387313 RepID=A0ABT1PGX4_9ACTN|nr:RICIN domain-containing protein [Streptantibioticus rubrisoli]MCQ4044600.1 RICIN domain-containing protein [Streptantibioticus rubrisoli]